MRKWIHVFEVRWLGRKKEVAEVWRLRPYPGYPPPPVKEGTISIRRGK